MSFSVKSKCHTLMAICAMFLMVAAASAQRTYTVDDYAHAEKFMGYNTNPMVYHAVRPAWLPDDRVWFRDTGPDGNQFVVVDAASGKREPAFDHAKLAAALSTAAEAKTPYTANKLPFNDIELSEDGKSISFAVPGAGGPPRRYRCDRSGDTCTAERRGGGGGGAGGGRGPARNDVVSPDKKQTAYIKDNNLWVRDLASGKETQLTTDGVKDFGYATDNAGWTKSDRAILIWSPDSKKIATYQQDQRNTGELYLVETKVGHPTLQAWKYPLPGDKDVTMIQRVVIDVPSAKVIRFQMPPDQHRSTQCDDIVCRGSEWADVQWTPDSARVIFVSTSRDHKVENMRVADVATGAVKDVMEENSPTQFESGQGRVNWRYLGDTNEYIWFTERDGWGHLYLYDFTTGKLKHQITKGDWAVQQVVRIDEKAHTIYFVATGREKGDPYFQHLYSVGFDGNNLKLLTPEDANHETVFSPTGKYFADTYSTADTPPTSVIRDLTGKVVAENAKADISKLIASGWKAPERIVVKARDGQTDLYGMLFKPTNMEPGKKYPIINHIYPGPQGGSVGSRSFSAARGDAQALAELGFVVVEIDGMGNPTRSKKFHDFYFANMGDNTLPDQIAAMKELAAKRPYIDIDKAGIYGHSGGGYATADAMFRYPEFFKVGISEAGNHDNRVYEDDWGERYQGLLVKNADGTTNYDDQANQNMAKNLKGHLLLAHGTMDDNVPPNNTLLVVDALIKANKDFDLIMLPNRHHGFGNEPYMVRRRWDYFVRYLAGGEPPKEYELKPPPNAFGF